MDQNSAGNNPELHVDLLNEDLGAGAPPASIGQPAAAEEVKPAIESAVTLTEEVPVAPPVTVGQEVEKPPVKPALINEEHTASNTTMLDKVAPASVFIKSLDEKAKEEGYLSIFLGNTRKVLEERNELVQQWLIFNATKSMYREQGISDVEFQTAQTNWAEYLEENHPGVDHDDMASYCYDLFQFMDNQLDNVKVRSAIVREPQTSNLAHRGSGYNLPDIVGKKPSANAAGINLADAMRRSSLNANKDLYQFSILLRNSFAAIDIRRPNNLSLGSLVLAIQNQIKGYVRKTNNPSMTLAYIAGIRCFWDYISNLILSCSVKDTRDYRELVDSILLTDMDALLVGMIKACNTKGFNLELRCLNPKCDWNQFGLADADKVYQIRNSVINPEQAAVHANLANSRRKYSREEMEALRAKTTYNMETNRVYSDDNTQYFVIGSPTLNQAFWTLDYFTEVINPRIQELRVNHLDEQAFENELSVLLTGISSAEYIHWIQEYTVLPQPGTDDKPVTYRRPTDDKKAHDEFNKGLMAILEDQPAMGNRLMAFIYNKTPFMSFTYTGVDNEECPHCKQKADNFDERKLGYTPINAFMSFFTLTQLKLMKQATQSDQGIQEALLS